jgi:transposase
MLEVRTGGAMQQGRRLSAGERQELKRLARREVGRVSERLHMVLLADRGFSVAQIAAIYECSETTVRQWLARFAASGVAGVRDLPRAGRPRKADAVARDVIRQTVASPPAEAGYAFGSWSVVSLCSHLAERLGLRLSRATVRRVLVGLDYRWRRPKHTLPDDPAAGLKMWALCERVLRAPGDAVLLCEDECDVHLLPVLRAMWMRRGQQAQIPTPGTNRKVAVFGALEPWTGRWTYELYKRKGAIEFIHFLDRLLQLYPGRPILLILDNASFHTARPVTRWLAHHPRLELLFLPTYSGHRHNPVEKVWWRLKDQVAANRLHNDLVALGAAIRAFFDDDFTTAAALQLVA